jgi:hypothetical protein
MGDGTSVGGVLARARTFVSGRPASQKVGAAGAAALLATAPFGGLSSTPEPPPEQLVLGHPKMVGPFRVDIDQVVELPDLAPAVTPEPDERLVIIDADVTLTGDRPEFAVTLTQNLDVTGGGVTLTKPPNLYVVEDSTRMSVFNPGVTYRLAITFVASGPWQGDTATVKANLVEYREEDRQTLNPDAWVGRDEIAWQGTLPVVRRP